LEGELGLPPWAMLPNFEEWGHGAYGFMLHISFWEVGAAKMRSSEQQQVNSSCHTIIKDSS
jgi:hypothetical protein